MKHKRLQNKFNDVSPNSESMNDNRKIYDQIPKELLRDLRRAGNFHPLTDDSKKQGYVCL